MILFFPAKEKEKEKKERTRVSRDSMARLWKMLKDLGDGPPFLCPKCGRTYSHKCNLTRHLRLECGVGPRFQCAWCKKRFKHRHHLRDHQRIHLYSNCTFELRN
ncbi:Longitudinals lacking protein, isoforms A/B/D/L [Anthophora quadrimaculata]